MKFSTRTKLMIFSVKTTQRCTYRIKIKNTRNESQRDINEITGRNDNKILATLFIDPNEINSFFNNLGANP